MDCFSATLSKARDVGIDRAHAANPPRSANHLMDFACAANTAKESDGDAKKRWPTIMFLSPSPSKATPNANSSPKESPGEPSSLRDARLTSSEAHLRFGSG